MKRTLLVLALLSSPAISCERISIADAAVLSQEALKNRACECKAFAEKGLELMKQDNEALNALPMSAKGSYVRKSPPASMSMRAIETEASIGKMYKERFGELPSCK